MTATYEILRSPIPEFERSEYVRDIVYKDDFTGSMRNHHGNCPASMSPEGYRQWKIDASDGGSRFAGPCTLVDFFTGVTCTGRNVYCGYYCTNARCTRSLEGSNLVFAIQSNRDIALILSLASMVLGDNATIFNLAQFISGFRGKE